MGVSQLVTNIVGVLRRLYTSTCIYSCVLCSCMHTHGHINVHSLHAGVQWVSRGYSDRTGVLQHLYTHTYLQDSCSHSKETMCVLHVSVQQLRSDGRGTLCIVCI